MPDGSPLPPSKPRLSADHRELLMVGESVMVKAVHVRAMVAWVRHVRPSRARGVPVDVEGLALHFGLFARDPDYWERLCGAWHALRLSP